MSRSLAVFLVGEVALLLVTQAVGGPPWTVVMLASVVALSLAGPRIEALGVAAASLLWLGAFRMTGDRELFFPYAMQLAATAISRGGDRGVGFAATAGGAVAAAFLGVRIWQQATARVLAVECVVVAAIVGGAVVLRGRLPRTLASEAAIVAAAAAAAYAGLAL
jgi:hypothetical protein